MTFTLHQFLQQRHVLIWYKAKVSKPKEVVSL